MKKRRQMVTQRHSHLAQFNRRSCVSVSAAAHVSCACQWSWPRVLRNCICKLCGWPSAENCAYTHNRNRHRCCICNRSIDAMPTHKCRYLFCSNVSIYAAAGCWRRRRRQSNHFFFVGANIEHHFVLLLFVFASINRRACCVSYFRLSPHIRFLSFIFDSFLCIYYWAAPVCACLIGYDRHMQTHTHTHTRNASEWLTHHTVLTQSDQTQLIYWDSFSTRNRGGCIYFSTFWFISLIGARTAVTQSFWQKKCCYLKMRNSMTLTLQFAKCYEFALIAFCFSIFILFPFRWSDFSRRTMVCVAVSVSPTISAPFRIPIYLYLSLSLSFSLCLLSLFLLLSL